MGGEGGLAGKHTPGGFARCLCRVFGRVNGFTRTCPWFCLSFFLLSLVTFVPGCSCCCPPPPLLSLYSVSVVARLPFSLCLSPPRREAGDVLCLHPFQKSQGCHLILLYSLLPSPVHLSVFLSSCWPFLLIFCLESSSILFVKRWSFFVWLLFSSCETSVGQWYVQHAAVWHWELLVGIYRLVFSASVHYIILKKSGC